MTSNPVAKQNSSNNYQPSVPITLYRELAAELQSTQAKLSTLHAQNEHLVRQNQMLVQELEAIAQSRQQMQELVVHSNQKIQEAIAQSGQSAFRVLDIVTKSRPTVVQLHPNSPSPVQQPQVQPMSQAQPQIQPIQTVGQRMQDVVARAKPPSAPQPQPQPSETLVSLPFQPQPKSVPTKLVTTQEEPTSLPKPETHQAGNLTGWWLALTVFIIVTTSFGAGYFLMRPFVK